jgi:hypothetical protein
MGRLGSISGPADAPELDFGGRNGSIFEVCLRSCAFGANFVQIQQNHVKTGATKQNQPEIVPKARSKPLGAPQALGRLTGRVLECLRGSPRTLVDCSWALLARPERPKIGF